MNDSTQKDYSRDLAVTTTYIYSEIFTDANYFADVDKAIDLAEAFIAKFPSSINWEEHESDWESELNMFIRSKKLVEGVAWLDGDENYKALSDPDERSNGWACPLIHESSIDKLITDLTSEDQKFTLEDGVLTCIFDDGEPEGHKTMAESEQINGETYYNLGQWGWVWDFTPNTENQLN